MFAEDPTHHTIYQISNDNHDDDDFVGVYNLVKGKPLQGDSSLTHSAQVSFVCLNRRGCVVETKSFDLKKSGASPNSISILLLTLRELIQPVELGEVGKTNKPDVECSPNFQISAQLP